MKGWDGGPAWLNGQTLLGRNNLALALTSTEDIALRHPLRPGRGAGASTASRTDAEAVDFLLDVFLQGDVPAAARDKLLDYLKTARSVKYPVYWTDDDVATTASGPSPTWC